MEDNPLILGVTGSFGSGCSTLANALKNQHGYKIVRLTDKIKETFKQKHPEGSYDLTKRRTLLQDIGNNLRKENGLEYLAKDAASSVNEENGPIVFDGIRNNNEVDFLRKKYPRFYLVSIYAPSPLRWERVAKDYNHNQSEFNENDKRDSGEDFDYGQKVQLCVDQADVAITNSENSSLLTSGITLLKRFDQYLKLLTGEELRSPTQDETNMASAYTFALNSLCLKRQVGAAIIDQRGKLVATGYNENPEPLAPCIKKFEFCYKDQWLVEHVKSMVDKKMECVYCRAEIRSETLKENTKCPKCNQNLAKAYAPDRGMSRCTAIHAEQMAILNATGRNIENGTLYTTTFPCLQCAKQIVYTGIKKVVYIEHYPDEDSEKFLKDFSQIEVKMFEGIKARAFERVFSDLRMRNEKLFPLQTNLN